MCTAKFFSIEKSESILVMQQEIHDFFEKNPLKSIPNIQRLGIGLSDSAKALEFGLEGYWELCRLHNFLIK